MLEIKKVNCLRLIYTCKCSICKNISEHRLSDFRKEKNLTFLNEGTVIYSLECPKCLELEKQKIIKVKNKFQLIRFKE